jgi:hypothetical protein
MRILSEGAVRKWIAVALDASETDVDAWLKGASPAQPENAEGR